MSASEARRIKLYCPTVKKIVEIVAWDEQRLDLGSIASAFGLEPSTLKLNGHFISRGLDLISSSVTWKSLLSFFSARRLSTGKHHADPLIVDGKLSRVGIKRAHEPEDGANSGVPAMEDTNLVKNKKIKKANSGENWDCRSSPLYNGLGVKRKQFLEDLSPLKKLRINETCPAGLSSEITEKGTNGFSKSISSSHLRCSPVIQNLKGRRCGWGNPGCSLQED